MRRRPKPTKAKVNAKPPVAHRTPKNQGSKVRDLEKRLAEALEREAGALKRESEALERQTATAEILRSISASPTDYQPVFDTIVRNAGSVCGAVDAILWTADGDDLVIRAHDGPIPGDLGARQPIQGSVAGRALSEARVVHVENLPESDDFPHGREVARRHGWHTTLSVPLLRQGVAVGAILIRRSEVRPFTPTEITLLQTFADQAVIAIENVRLFTELEGRNRDLTATAEILRVISTSPTDLQPVLDTVVTSAARLCGAYDATMVRLDGGSLRVAAHYGPIPVAANLLIPIVPGSISGRAVLERQAIHVADVLAQAAEFPEASAYARDLGFRTMLSVPLLWEGVAIGTIALRRVEVNPFTDKQIKLLETFADQAVIAIENVRLFKELEARNRDLTATGEVLQVISRSPTDVQPVFEAIADSAIHLFDALGVAVVRYDGELVSMAAARGGAPGSAAVAAERFGAPHRPIAGFPPEQAVLTMTMHHVADVETDPSCSDEFRRHAHERGFRSIVSMPMLRGSDPVGAIVVFRGQPGAFSAAEVELLHTFADQAVIAIENVRLFKELQASNSGLRVALEQQTATSEVLKVISRSTFDLRPVLDTLIENATRLCGATRGHIFRFDGDVLRFAASYGATPEFVEWLEQNPVLLGPGSVAGRAASERRMVHVHDVLVEPGYEWLDLQRLQDYRTVLAVPMLRENTLLGVITILKTKAEPFSQRSIELVATFADQAVIAIENVRLLRELQERTGELARSVEELKVLGEVSRAVSSSLDLETVLNTIVARAVQLSNAAGGTLYEYDEATHELGRISGAHRLDEELGEVLRANPIRLGEGAAGRAAAQQTPVQIADVLAEGAYDVARVRAIFERHGYRSLLAVPLVLERQILGVLVVWGREPVGFAQEIVDLLQTLANQSVLAIQNARLFREIADKSAQLEAASRHKSEFLANMSHELRTPLNAIIGFSEVLTERMFGELNEKQEEYLKDIYASGQHLLSLINDILDLSKIEAGRMELELTDFDLPSAIDNALILVRERASRRGITLGHSVDERLGSIRADERKVKQVLLNLLSNALKFTPEGGRIDVTARVQDGVAEIAVADTGVGIAPEDQEAVFEEFRQVGTADKKVEGTGLGLALSRKFIELHGGRIWVESEVGKGSTFRFTLPVRRGG